MRNEPTEILEALKNAIRKSGFRPSAGCWEDDQQALAFSVEDCGPATYGHPRFEAVYRKDSGWLSMTGKPDVPIPEPLKKDTNTILTAINMLA